MLFPYLFKVSLLLAVLTLGYRWMVQFETFSKMNRVLLWLNVLAAWTLPLVRMPDWGPKEIQSEFHRTIPKIAAAAPAVTHRMAPYNPAPTVINPQTLQTLNLAELLLAIYFAGVLIFTGLFLFQIGRLILTLSRSPVEKSDQRVIFVRDKSIRSPYSFFHWIVLNPENHSPEELRHIIAHETEHATQWHSLDLVAAEMQRVVLWFNPFSWFHQKLVQANLEYLADRGVLEGGFEKKQYQYSLLNAVLQKRDMPLTNSFAHSLLKNRIRMMNKKPSHYLAWGKYGLILAALYFSSAFVAPYQYQLLTLAPKVNNLETGKPLNTEKRTKGIFIRDNTLYWTVTPLMTWEDLTQMRAEVKKFGAEMSINGLQYDPLQKFITSISINTQRPSGGGASGSVSTKDFMPIEGYSGFMTASSGGIGMTDLPEPLSKELKEDYEKALLLHKNNETTYFEHLLSERIGANSGATYPKESFERPASGKLLESIGIGKSAENTLRITAMHRQSALYLNAKPATLAELNALPFERFEKVVIRQDQAKKKYVIVYAK